MKEVLPQNIEEKRGLAMPVNFMGDRKAVDTGKNTEGWRDYALENSGCQGFWGFWGELLELPLANSSPPQLHTWGEFLMISSGEAVKVHSRQGITWNLPFRLWGKGQSQSFRLPIVKPSAENRKVKILFCDSQNFS